MASDEDKTNDAQGGWLIQPDAAIFLSWMKAFGGSVLEGDGYHFDSQEPGSHVCQTTLRRRLRVDPAPGEDAPTAFGSHQALFATVNLEQLPDFGDGHGDRRQRR